MCARRVLKAGSGGEIVQGPLSRRPKAEPDLFSDPMPARVEPCLALLTSKVPTGSDWSYEVKWDGYRLAVHIDRGKVHIITRGGHDWTHRFPNIALEAAGLPLETAILDGEAVVLGENGASDFGALQRSLGGRGGKVASKAAILYAFDLLYLDGHDLRSMSLTGTVIDGVEHFLDRSYADNIGRLGYNVHPTIEHNMLELQAYGTLDLVDGTFAVGGNGAKRPVKA